MRKLLPFLLLLFAVPCFGQTWGTLPADLVIHMDTSTAGTTLTPTIATAGTSIRPSATFTWASVPAGMTVGANQGQFINLGPVQINNGGTLYPAGTLLGNSIGHPDTANNTVAVLQSFGGTGSVSNGCGGTTCHIYSAMFPFTTGIPALGNTGNLYDMFFMFDTPGNYFGVQITGRASNNCPNSATLPASGVVVVRIEGKLTSHSPCFALLPQQSYVAAITGNFQTGVSTLYLYTSTGTQIFSAGASQTFSGTCGNGASCAINSDGSVTLTAPNNSSSPLDHVYIGNNENWNNDSNTSFYQNILIDWTDGSTFGLGNPYFWKQTDPWAGVLAPVRGATWSNAGVVGGIPARTSPVCATEPAGTPTSTIDSDITSCSGSGGGLVSLAAGSFSGTLTGASNVTVRGAGANQTTFTASGNWNLVSGVSAGNNLTTWTPGGGVGGVNPFSLINPWPAEINTISLASSTNLKVGTLAVFDQLDQSVDYGAILVTQSTTALTAVAPGVAGAYVSQGDAQGVSRGTCNGALSTCNSQQQSAIVTQCDGVTTPGHACSSGANITINPPLVMPNWGFDLGGNSLSPSVWYSSNLPVQGFGLEDIGIDMSSCSGCVLTIRGGYSDWIKGVSIVNESPGNTGTINTPYSLDLSIINSYIGPTAVSGTGVYGINPQYCNFCLIENNIVQSVPTPFIFNGGGVGNVLGYNYATGGFYTGSSQYNIPAFGDHAAGIAKNLFEGNQTNGYTGDSIHGVSDLEVFFRNGFWGSYPSCWVSGSTEATSTYGQCTQNMTPINDSAGHRFISSLGNILGMTGVQSLYSTTSFVTGVGSSYAIYQYGSQTSSVADSSNLQQTAMIWGNADAKTGFGSPRFNCSEVMNGTAFSSLNAVWMPLYNPCPLSNTLPSSFYYSSKPSWWPSGKPWPIIGPDVTGGNLLLCTGGTQTRSLVTSVTASLCTTAGGTTSTYAAGLSNSNPAMDCFLSLGGNPNGTGGPLSNFNEATCYSGSSTAASAPTCNKVTGTYFPPLSDTCSTTSVGAIICFTTDGTTPVTDTVSNCTNGTLYSGTLSISSSATYKFVAGGTGFLDSPITTYAYTIVNTVIGGHAKFAGTVHIP